MQRRDEWKVWVGATALTIAATVTPGCSTLRMKPPGDLVEISDEYEASGRSLIRGGLVNESFVLGPYRVAEVDRAWGRTRTRGAEEGAPGYRSSDSEGGYTFQFREGEEALAAECAHSNHGATYRVLGIDTLSSNANLVCVCGEGPSAARLEMAFDDRRDSGRVTIPGGTFDVSSVHDQERGWKSSDPLGYRVGKEGEPLGGVETINSGRIWLSRALDAGERRQLGCLLAGLMLFDKPDPGAH